MDKYYEVALTWEHCVNPSLATFYAFTMDLLTYNLLFNITTQSVHIPTILFHALSFFLGFMLLLATVAKENIWHFLIFLLAVYFCTWVMRRVLKLNVAYITGISCIGYLLLCEFYHPRPNIWKQSRGIFMIAVMKIISLCFDQQENLPFPTIVEFFGYVFCPANCLLGPWIPFTEYISIKDNPKKKNFKWVLRISFVLMLSVFFLTFSNCFGTLLIPEEALKWAIAYRQAQSFRASHYFVSYLSEVTMLTAGYSDEKRKGQSGWGYQVTNPLHIEFPSSLVNVVINWNIPTHKFLKKYVYKTSLRFGQFKAILTTYLVSSLLHGFNVEIAVVLLTIGLYSYIQLQFQDKVSTALNACLGVRPCKSCRHKYKATHVFVKLAKIAFSLITTLNLTYLGVLMHSIGEADSPTFYEKWANLDFLSHWLMLALHLYTIV